MPRRVPSIARAGVHDVEVGVAAGAAQHRVGRAHPRGAAPRRPATRRSRRSGRGRRTGRRRPGTPSTVVSATRKPPTSPGASSARSGTGCHAAAPCRASCTRLSSESAGITVAVDSGSCATTSIEVISGAAARTASSTASSRVTADDGQLLQLPENCSRTASSPVRRLEQVHVTAVRAEVGPHAVQGVGDPAFARRAGAGRAPAAGWRPGRRRRVRRPPPGLPRTASRHQPLQPGAVEVGDLADQLLGALSRDRAARRARVEQRLDPIARRAPLRVVLRIRRRCVDPDGPIRYSPVTDWVGECSLSRVLPSPRYMCTPQGRHGSKLRTVRMMSMPLKCSRSFSSKIG